MTTHTLYPLLLEAKVLVKVWGGRKLHTLLNKSLPSDAPYGEAWELHDDCLITNGAYAGQSVGAVLQKLPLEMLGKPYDTTQGFPLLVKLIHAEDWLSVQVHPNDAQAEALEGQPRGKTEAWIILHAEPQAQLVIGVHPNTTRHHMAQAIATNALEPLLVYQSVRAGDVLFMPAGTIHAIGPGIVLYEVQQSSDTTYRLYDWGRLDLDGTPRPLHIEKGVMVANLASLPHITHIPMADTPAPMVTSDYFHTYFYPITADAPIPCDTNGQTFHSLTTIAGEVVIMVDDMAYPLSLGRTALIPACIGAYRLVGAGHVLVSWG